MPVNLCDCPMDPTVEDGDDWRDHCGQCDVSTDTNDLSDISATSGTLGVGRASSASPISSLVNAVRRDLDQAAEVGASGFPSMGNVLDAVAELSREAREAERMPPAPQDSVPVALPLIPQCTRCGTAGHTRRQCAHPCMECSQPWPAHSEGCVLRYDPADVRLAASAEAVLTAPIADVECGEIFHPAEATTARVAAVRASSGRSEASDEVVSNRTRSVLMDRYIDRFPAVWDLAPRQWIRCASEEQFADICRAVAEVEERFGEQGVDGSSGAAVWGESSQAALRQAYARMHRVVAGVAADISDTMSQAVGMSA